jgi:hypothetical protein
MMMNYGNAMLMINNFPIDPKIDKNLARKAECQISLNLVFLNPLVTRRK